MITSRNNGDRLWKMALLLILSTHTTNGASLVCYRGSTNNSKELPLKQSPDFMNTEFITEDCDLIIVIHGYSANISQPILNIVQSLISKFGDTKCYCALNWEKEADTYIGSLTDPVKNALGIEILGLNYPGASIIAGFVAKILSEILLRMKTLGLKILSLYLMGHSEGACLAGSVARCLQEKGITIARVTGLDPAKPPVEKPLSKGCAKLVDCVHTNPNGLGTNKAVCDIDFWINDGCKVQPGCPQNSIPLTDECTNLCSHKRAMLYQAEAIKDPDSFQGRKASDNRKLENSTDNPEPVSYNLMGFNIDSSNTGSFYMCTNAKSPFGKGPKGMNPSVCPTTVFDLNFN